MKRIFHFSFYVACIILLSSCSPNRQKPQVVKETVIFRTSEHNLIFSLTIDDKFSYSDSLRNENVTLGYKIGVFKKDTNKLSTIKLKINDKDTVFQFPLYKVDSILFGLTAKRTFYIITNKDRNNWIFD